jgi:hypothetical protein
VLDHVPRIFTQVTKTLHFSTDVNFRIPSIRDMWGPFVVRFAVISLEIFTPEAL